MMIVEGPVWKLSSGRSERKALKPVHNLDEDADEPEVGKTKESERDE